MTIQIVILNTNGSSDGSFSVSGVFWLVPSGNYIPQPNFKSQVPFIDTPNLEALQIGTLIEQYFETGLYAPGTSLTTVQVDLQAQYSAAQTSLNGVSSPLNIVGYVYSSPSGWSSTNPFTPFTSLKSTGTLNALNSTVQISMYQYNSVGVQIVAGSFIGAIIAESSTDDGYTWNQVLFNLVSSNQTLNNIKSYGWSWGSANNNFAATIVVNGGAGIVRVRAYSYTSGSCNVLLRASNIIDESIELFSVPQGTANPPTVAVIGGQVTTATPAYTTGTANALSLNLFGELRVDGSGVTQPVSGTVTANQGAANTTANSWPTTITDGTNGPANIVNKGTQATNALGVQDYKDSGRVSFVAVCSATAGVTTEALISLTPIRTVTAGAAGTSLAITSGKTLRLQGMTLSIRNTSTTQAGSIIRLHMNAGTVTVSSQKFFAVGTTSLNALSGGTNQADIEFPDGFEISGTTQIGISQLCSTTSCTIDVSLYGFEY